MAASKYIGIDVGSHSVRCGVVSETGKVLSTAVHPILTTSPRPEFYQQSSDNIWHAICKAVNVAMEGHCSDDVKGIGFDATCSLVTLDASFKPLSVSPDGEPEQNIILWMDHRATEEAQEINSKKFDILKYVGGKISVEMEPPKLLWLKKNLKVNWDKLAHAFDLPDYLTWRATGSLSRSLCSTVCKMMFQADSNALKWDKNFWTSIHLEELVENNFEKIGKIVQPPGSPCGNGLTKVAAKELGLPEGTPVAASMIDAYAGGIGCLGCLVDGVTSDFTSRLVMICGTSTCHMAMNEKPMFVSGVWGPYFSVMVPGFWCNEAGQSAAGALIDHVIDSHPASKSFQDKLASNNEKDSVFINKRDIQLGLAGYLLGMSFRKGATSVSHLTADLHVWPDFHGNRSPIADPTLKGMVSGLSLSAGVDDLACLYLATVQALAYSTKHILQSMEMSGHRIQSIVMCGGLSKNNIYAQMHADVTGLPVLLPEEEESVLLGSAILGAAAARDGQLQETMRSMGGMGRRLMPAQDTRYHEMKYKVFLSMLELQKMAKQTMKEFL